MATLALAGSIVVILGIVLWVAFAAVKRLERARVESENSRDALGDRQRMDEVLARRIGRRQALLRFLRNRESGE